MSEENVSNNEIGDAPDKKFWSWIIAHKNLIYGFICGIITTVIPVIFFIGNHIDNKIMQRMAPFEHLLTGIALINYGNYKDALPELSQAYDIFKELKPEPLVTQRMAFVDSFLHSLAESKPNNLQEYSHYIDNLTDEIVGKNGDSKIPKNAERLDHLGTIYLYTGKIEEAKKFYQDSLIVGEDYLQEAKTHWNLVLYYMAEGKLIPAVNEYKKARNKDPAEYNLEDVIKNQEMLFNKHWIIKLKNEYSPEFDDTFEKFYERLVKLKNEEDEHDKNRSENNEVVR